MLEYGNNGNKANNVTLINPLTELTKSLFKRSYKIDELLKFHCGNKHFLIPKLGYFLQKITPYTIYFIDNIS